MTTAQRKPKQPPDPLSRGDRAFVREYIVDFDAPLAAIRTGIAKLNARKWARQRLAAPTVLAEIEIAIQGAKRTELANPNRIIAGLVAEANRLYNSGSERIQALKTLAAIAGVLKSGGGAPEDPDAPLGGVMEVPGIAGQEEWDKVARKAQSRLMERVRE